MADESDTATSETRVASTGPGKRVHRRRRTGRVVSDRCNKTITVAVDYLEKHRKYGKYIRKRIKLHVHDDENQAKVGDIVDVAECRPLSKTKNWRLVRVQTPGAGR